MDRFDRFDGRGQPAASAAPAIQILSAEKTYPDGTHALQPVDLTIEEGEFVTLLGPSGCGKSTLLKMIAGLLAPSDGRLLLWHRPVAELHSRTNKLAFVFQSPTLMPWASVQSNVRLPLELAGTPRAEADARVAEALKLVGLGKFRVRCRARCRAACRCACRSRAASSRSRSCC